jgi:cysteine desulfuration protein SufE
MTLEMIRSDFAFLGDWEDRYRYVVELGRGLPPFPEGYRTHRYKVRGCANQVWLATETERQADGVAVLRFRGDSDAHIVRGLSAILFAIYSGQTADDVLVTDGQAIFADLGLKEHVTPVGARPDWRAQVRGVILAEAQVERAGAKYRAHHGHRRGHLAHAKRARLRHRSANEEASSCPAYVCDGWVTSPDPAAGHKN